MAQKSLKCHSQSVSTTRILDQRSKFHDFDFFKSVATKPSTPWFQMVWMQAQRLKPCIKAMYTPLIDMTPSDPTTMKSAMLEA